MASYKRTNVKIYTWENCPKIDLIKDLQKIAWWNDREIALYTEAELFEKYKKGKTQRT